MDNLVSYIRIKSMANLLASRLCESLEDSYNSEINNDNKVEPYILLSYLIEVYYYTLKHSDILKDYNDKLILSGSEMLSNLNLNSFSEENPLTYYDIKTYIFDNEESTSNLWGYKGELSKDKLGDNSNSRFFLESFLNITNARSYLESLSPKPIRFTKMFMTKYHNFKIKFLSKLYQIRNSYELINPENRIPLSKSTLASLAVFERISEYFIENFDISDIEIN